MVKFIALPLGAALVFINDLIGSFNLPTWVSTFVNIGALAILFAGFIVVARYRALAEVEGRAAEAWKEERDAEMARADRLDQHVKELQQQYDDQRDALVRLQGMPDLRLLMSMLEAHDDKNAKLISDVIRQLRENGGKD